MGMIAVRLSEAAEEYVLSCRSRGDKAATLKTKRSSLDKLLLNAGNILLRNVTPSHIDSLFGELQSAGLRASTINLHRNNLVHFFKWCQTRRYITNVVTPMDGVRPLRVLARDQLRVPASKFGHLLDCAEHPRDRIVVALALYLFLRQSEIKRLRVGDVNLDDGFVTTVIYKTSQRDQMPISAELDEEIRRWMRWYSAHVDAPLQTNWFLCPVRSRPRFTGGPHGFRRINEYDTLAPTRHLERLEGIAQRALERAGYSLHDVDGSSSHVGMHTLRRSGARARYDFLIERGHDGALREVQAMLHHSSTNTTEGYLGITLDIKRRNESIRGKRMFPGADSATVVRLEDHRVSGE